MRRGLRIVSGLAACLFVADAAVAGQDVRGSTHRRILPPVSGTLRIPRDDFGRSSAAPARQSLRFAGRSRGDEHWYGNGTGVVGMLARSRAAERRTTDLPLEVTYGEPDLWWRQTGFYGAGSPGGLGYYNSGSPGALAYYSSGSSAGPYGSTGGLAVYSSGAYGPGPVILHLGRHAGNEGVRRICHCGPHIIRIGRNTTR